MPLLSVRNLRTSFHLRSGVVRAVNDVTFDVDKGEVLGIVGESGCGKSVMCYSLLGLVPVPPGRIESGSAMFGDTDLLSCALDVLRGIRGRSISMIFQDPMTSLNPYLRIGEQVAEPLVVHGMAGSGEARALAVEALRHAGIADPQRAVRCYPHEFSGGMRQRVMIAAALITRPALLIADEPTTALDVTVQAQILSLIRRLQRNEGMSVMFITHDMGVIARMADRVAVMYAGNIVELAPVRALFAGPRHPYTRALQQSIAASSPPGVDLYTIPGAPPDLSPPIDGCPFAPRCAHAMAVCRTGVLTLAPVAEGHATACLRAQRGEL